MGQPVCANLVRAGYVVTAGDVRAELESMVAGWGARWAAARLLRWRREAEVLITMLPGTQELHDVMLVPGGALAALPRRPPGSI
jgi:3-hydroxyisobutyrate dehydrogenase-like beta-hydroxyacid dehydrogenase